MTTLPEPGVYFDVPERDYHAWDLPSASRLDVLRQRTAAHLRWDLDNPEETEALLVGRAVHSRILTPERYPLDFATAPKVDRRTKDGKERWAEFVANAGARSVLTEEQGLQVEDIARAAAGSKLLTGALRLCPKREVSLVAEIDGMRIKARVDAYGFDSGTAIDIKTDRDASVSAFQRSLVNYGYGFRATVYREVMQALRLPCERFLYFVIEKEAPHCHATYQLADEVHSLFRCEVSPLLARWYECKASGVWPGYPSKLETITLPDWYVRTLARDEVAA